jgi:diguanylate cyclase (GGDEF)-like protein/PAS domain S-box-containing protein
VSYHITTERRSLQILLIEDNKGDADLVLEGLEGETRVSFDVVWADSLGAGQKLLAQGGIDLVILDLSLPDSQGLDTFRAIHEHVPQVPIVILTGLDDQELALQTLHEGGQDFLVKSQGTLHLLPRMIHYAVQRKQAEAELLRAEERYRILFETIPHPICVFARESGAFLAVNPVALEQYGYSREEILGLRIQDLGLPESEGDLKTWLAMSDFRPPLRTRHRRKNGEILDVEMRVGEVDFAGEIAGFAIVTDISDRKRAEERLEYQALHDALTGLPNRASLQSHVERLAATTGGETDRPFAFLLLDLDRFKEINDSLGHCYGDWVLQHLSSRFRASVRRSDTIARLGGDEYAVLLPGATAKEAFRVVEKIEAALRAPILVQGRSLTVGASIGISLYPRDGRDWDTLMQRADIAMYKAKQSGCGHLLYTGDPSDDYLDQLELTGELRQALEENQLELYYQPKVDLVTMRVAGVEALIRWQHPRRGLLMASRIVALAEHAGLIRRLGHWVLSKAASQSIAWQRIGIDLEIAINLAAQNFQDPEMIAAVIRHVGSVNSHRLQLTLEITEGAMLSDPEQSRAILGSLHELGVKISIDDFGTGYSSLAYLKNLPVDEVKIDQSLVRSMVGDSRDSCIVRTIIELGHNLGLRVVAEGVEAAGILEILTEFRCDVAQGYYLSHPLPHLQLESWYRGTRSRDLSALVPTGTK